MLWRSPDSLYLSVSSEPSDLNERRQELAALTEERAAHLIRSLRPFVAVPPDPFNGMGLVEQQAILHGRRATRWVVQERVVLTTCSAEDLVVHKALAGRGRDWDDLESARTPGGVR